MNRKTPNPAADTLSVSHRQVTVTSITARRYVARMVAGALFATMAAGVTAGTAVAEVNVECQQAMDHLTWAVGEYQAAINGISEAQAAGIDDNDRTAVTVLGAVSRDAVDSAGRACANPALQPAIIEHGPPEHLPGVDGTEPEGAVVVDPLPPVDVGDTANEDEASETHSVNWDAVAQCESSGDWGIDTGNGFFGGLQFTMDTWLGHGGEGNPANASREEQIQVAERVLETQGIGAWPVCGANA